MLHKNLAQSLRGRADKQAGKTGPQLVQEPYPSKTQVRETALPELASISARRCSAFFAEAAVLVLVFGILDFFMQHGHVSGPWVLGALSISVGLLCASVLTEFSARRWLGAQP